MKRWILLVGLSLLAFWPLQALAQLDAAGVKNLLLSIDERQKNAGDYKALVVIHTKEKGKDDMAIEAVIYRRDVAKRFMILFLKPKSERGKGYLRIDKNLWLYDPAVGRWDRRTERERIAGTDSRRADFDESRLSKNYTAEYVAQEKLGRFTVHRLRLTALADADVPYPVLELWVDVETSNILKSQEFASSGRLMRTVYTPKWSQVHSESKGGPVWYPSEIRIFDEVEKENSTVILMKSIDLRRLDDSIFTKAWVEGKSR